MSSKVTMSNHNHIGKTMNRYPESFLAKQIQRILKKIGNTRNNLFHDMKDGLSVMAIKVTRVIINYTSPTFLSK